MKKIIQIVSLFFLFFLLFCLLFSIFGVAELIEHLIVGGKKISFHFSSFCETVFQMFLFHLNLILFFTSLFSAFFYLQNKNQNLFFYVAPFFFSFFIFFGTYFFVSSQTLSAVTSPHCENCAFSNLNPDYEYEILHQEKVEPKNLLEMHQLSEDVNDLIRLYKNKGILVFLIFCFSIILFNYSFSFYASLTSWPFLNFLLLLFIYVLYSFFAGIFWGDFNLFLLRLLKKEPSSLGGMFILPFELFGFSLVNFLIMIPILQNQKKRRVYGSQKVS